MAWSTGLWASTMMEFFSHGAWEASGNSIFVAMVMMVSSGILSLLASFLARAAVVLQARATWQKPVESRGMIKNVDKWEFGKECLCAVFKLLRKSGLKYLNSLLLHFVYAMYDISCPIYLAMQTVTALQLARDIGYEIADIQTLMSD